MKKGLLSLLLLTSLNILAQGAPPPPDDNYDGEISTPPSNVPINENIIYLVIVALGVGLYTTMIIPYYERRKLTEQTETTNPPI